MQGGTTFGVYGKDAQIHTFLADGTLTVTGTGVVDVLLVGGGGGGGVVIIRYKRQPRGTVVIVR